MFKWDRGTGRGGDSSHGPIVEAREATALKFLFSASAAWCELLNFVLFRVVTLLERDDLAIEAPQLRLFLPPRHLEEVEDCMFKCNQEWYITYKEYFRSRLHYSIKRIRERLSDFHSCASASDVEWVWKSQLTKRISIQNAVLNFINFLKLVDG